jgi:hypothetical protein
MYFLALFIMLMTSPLIVTEAAQAKTVNSIEDIENVFDVETLLKRDNIYREQSDWKAVDAYCNPRTTTMPAFNQCRYRMLLNIQPYRDDNDECYKQAVTEYPDDLASTQPYQRYENQQQPDGSMKTVPVSDPAFAARLLDASRYKARKQCMEERKGWVDGDYWSSGKRSTR